MAKTSTGKQTEVERLQICRKNRMEEFETFLTRTGQRRYLWKFMSFLTDHSAKDLRLNVTEQPDSYTDGVNVTIGMPDMFFDAQYGPDQWAALLKALLVHEIQHVNSSNFCEIPRLEQAYTRIMEPRGMSPDAAGSISSSYLNIMEDSRIEHIIRCKLPGMKPSLQMLNQEIRRLCAPDRKSRSRPTMFWDFLNNCLSYALTGELAPNVSVYAGTRFEKEFMGVRHWFDEARVAETSADCARICLQMLEQTADYFAELLQTPKSQERVAHMNRPGLCSGLEYRSNGEREFNPGGGASPSSVDFKGVLSADEVKEMVRAMANTLGRNPDSGSAQSGAGVPPAGNPGDSWTCDGSKCAEADLPFPSLSPEGQAALIRGLTARNRNSATRRIPPTNNRMLPQIQARYHDDEKVQEYRETFPDVGREPLPPELDAAVRRLDREFERILRMKRQERRFTRSGILDGRNLYRTGWRDPDIFLRKGTPIETDMAVHLLLDNSGSMSCYVQMQAVNGQSPQVSKSQLSRTAASVMEMALSRFAALKVTLFDVRGGRVRHLTLKQFDQKESTSQVYNSIKRVGVGGGNKDGYSIRVASGELLSRREARKILIILSDGLPSDYAGGEEAALHDVRTAVREARRSGITVIPIMFGDQLFREEKKEQFAYMYDSFVSCDPENVLDEFTRLFLGLVRRS